jgi:hypothetical protein
MIDATVVSFFCRFIVSFLAALAPLASLLPLTHPTVLPSSGQSGLIERRDPEGYAAACYGFMKRKQADAR